ncbi:dienelactone hydrolase family protein [Gluconacetobacter azotocaptans]|uniref:Dienelactone hydrolase family protein n=1 Tax=Gluconacetobacter azotocaptans TaxID=142834 RepID=A0A7W4JPT2_9PROT|nr:dienelactone hydrolase family protein [Gluconacetobacter azotocaptans]MBB2188657.1 dienelactone hydrolase family protein [Gluconacetobacter azotocaptans]MBM9400419.1 dienelactone hydrolase family protein [Gluconacetobacter azotocaptans]
MRCSSRLIGGAALVLGLLAAPPAWARMVAKPVGWALDGTRFQSVLVYDDAVAAKRPGLVMVPNWRGVNAIAIDKAKMIAGRDYVILLTDMYGASIRPADDRQAMAAVKPLLSDRMLMRARVRRALDELQSQAVTAPIDLSRLAAIGFCFGGAAVLDLARSGADVKAVVSFHGNLTTDDPALARRIRADVLVMNGADDAMTSPDFGAFLDEMRQTPTDWQFVVIGHAVHCFTETEATAPTGMCRYDARAAARSYALMRQWLAARFTRMP